VFKIEGSRDGQSYMKIMLPILWYNSFIGLTSIIDDFKYGNEISFFAPQYHIYLLPAYSGDLGHINRGKPIADSGSKRPVSSRLCSLFNISITIQKDTNDHESQQQNG
jgi:hypothetical protein